MRLPLIITAACATALSFTGTAYAAAYPVKDSKLTENELYTVGAIPETECAEKPIRNNDRKSAQRYITAMVKCLDAAWEPALTGVGLAFTKPKLTFASKLPRKYCGIDVDKSNSHTFYCDKTRTITYHLGKDFLAEADDMWLMHNTAAFYAYHVQYLTGIEKAWYKITYSGKKELREQNRRLNLQSDCLGGVFVKSIWPSLRRSPREWNQLLGVVKENGGWAGKGANRVAWTKLGFASGDPASCNTWTAASSKVS